MPQVRTQTQTPVFQLDSLEVTLGDRKVLGPLDLELSTGSFVAIVGPNGSGKTTLLRALTGAVSPSAGRIMLQDQPLTDYHPLELAKTIGIVPQTFTLDFSFTVEEMVELGRYAQTARSPRTSAHLNLHSSTAESREDPVADALSATGLLELADRPITQLSGGERQRALIAQTLAQSTPTLLLDEPLNNLDLNYQLETMQLLRDLNSKGITIVVILHDLNMAAQYCDELIFLDHGLIAAKGAPQEVLDPRLILEIFKTRVSVHRQGRRPYVTPVWSEPTTAPAREDKGRVHIVAGGGAATGLIEELVMRGFTPSVGVVSVFDTDYATAQAYGLEVVSAPPFEAFSTEAMAEFDALAAQAETLIIAPVFFGRGNIAPLHTALRAARSGVKVVVIDHPSIADRDLSGGEATKLIRSLAETGAVLVDDPVQAVAAL